MNPSQSDRLDSGEEGTLEVTLYISTSRDRVELLQYRLRQFVLSARTVSARVHLNFTEVGVPKSVVTYEIRFVAMMHPLPRDRKATIYGQEVLDAFISWLTDQGFRYTTNDSVIINLSEKG